MKKLFCLALLVLCFAFPAYANSAFASVNDDAVQAMLESTLEKGFHSQKDLQSMIDNAFLNGFDYFDVTYSKGAFQIKVAINGFASALTALENDASEDASKELMRAKETILSHFESICDLLRLVGRNAYPGYFKIADDIDLAEYGEVYASDLFTLLVTNTGDRSIMSVIDAWEERPQKESK